MKTKPMRKSIIKAWQGRRGENIELGSQIIMTDKLIKILDSKVVENIELLLLEALSRKMIQGSVIPQSFLCEKGRDFELRGWELYIHCDTILQPTLLPLALKMDTLLRQAHNVLQQKRISAKQKADWLQQLYSITGEGMIPEYIASIIEKKRK